MHSMMNYKNCCLCCQDMVKAMPAICCARNRLPAFAVECC